MKTEIVGSRKWRVRKINQVADILKQDKRFSGISKHTQRSGTELVLFTDRDTNIRYLVGFMSSTRQVVLYDTNNPHNLQDWSYERFKPTNVVRAIKK